MNVRVMDPKEIPAVLALDFSVTDPPALEVELLAWIASPDTRPLVAVESRRVVGYLIAREVGEGFRILRAASKSQQASRLLLNYLVAIGPTDRPCGVEFTVPDTHDGRKRAAELLRLGFAFTAVRERDLVFASWPQLPSED